MLDQMPVAAPLANAENIPPTRPPRIAAHRTLLRDVLEVVIMVITIYTMVNLGTARAIVLGDSMLPNFKTDQLVIINRFAYYFASPSRGDVIVLHNPADRCKDKINSRSVITIPFLSNDKDDHDCEDLIKRVIGLPGETITIRDGVVYANGSRLVEPYIDAENFCATCNGTWALEADQYFVMGDNRVHSYDSHNFGPIRRDLVVGQAWVRYFPINDFQIIPHPRYGTINESSVDVPTAEPTTPPATIAPYVPDGAPDGFPSIEVTPEGTSVVPRVPGGSRSKPVGA